MDLLQSIFRKIFPSDHPAVQSSAGTAAPAPTAPPAQRTTSEEAARSVAPAPSPAPAVAGVTQVDVEAMLNGLAQKNAQTLNWKTSIVDLLKLLGLDSSLQARKALAEELHYSGDTGDSAGMNIWLHQQVMRKIAENGGKVPEDLKH